MEPVEILKRPRDPNDWGFWKERCYLKVQQYREVDAVVVEETPKPLDRRAQAAAKQKAEEEAKKKAEMAELGSDEEPPFELERIPAKVSLLSAINPEQDLNMIVHHAGKFPLP